MITCVPRAHENAQSLLRFRIISCNVGATYLGERSMNLDRPNPSADLSSTAQPARSPLRRMISGELFQGAREVQIEHRGEVYRLLETRNGKLILQK